jgi:predicted MPP superfamily phosphohydrolase
MTSSTIEAPGLPSRWRAVARAVVFGNLGTCLALAFAAAQSFLVLWFLLVWGDQTMWAAQSWAAATLVLVGAHYLALGRGKDARVLTHCFAPSAQAYVVACFSSCIVAAAIVAALVGGAIVSTMLGWAGPAHTLAFSVLRATTTAAAGLGLATVVLGLAAARRAPARRDVRVAIADLPPELRGFRIAHVSDLHVGNGFGIARLRDLVARINALQADMIAITGDVFDRDPAFVEPATRVLAELRAPSGVFMVLGNHDAYTGKELVAAAIAEHAPHIRLLRGDVVTIEASATLHVAGIDDPGEDWRLTTEGLRAVGELAKKLPASGPKVLLVHRPDVFEVAARAGFDVVLAGHYHGGQIALPGSGGRVNPGRLLSPWFAGSHRLETSTLHVSRGIGCTGPRLRIACVPELSVLELAPSTGEPTPPASR